MRLNIKKLTAGETFLIVNGIIIASEMAHFLFGMLEQKISASEFLKRLADDGDALLSYYILFLAEGNLILLTIHTIVEFFKSVKLAIGFK